MPSPSSDDPAQLLRDAASMMPPDAPLDDFRALLDRGELQSAWGELKSIAEERSLPLGFWASLSRAAEALKIRW